MTEEYSGLLEELFQGRLDESSTITSPMQIDLADQITIGKRVFVNNNFICMARGGVEIEDDVMIAPGVSLLTANHDLYAYEVLLCSPIHIKKNAWIGAKAIILPGVIIGENAVIAAGSVVTKDVEDNTVVGGNPSGILQHL